ENLLEDLRNRQPLSTPSYIAKKLLQIPVYVNTPKIAHKQTQPTSTGQHVVSHFYIVNNFVAISCIFATISHNILPPVGLQLWLVIDPSFAIIPQCYPIWMGFFITKNRSVQVIGNFLLSLKELLQQKEA